MNVGIIDYGMGNLASVQRAFEEFGAQAAIIADPGAIISVDRLILPGVGSFRQAMENLSRAGFTNAIRRAVQDGKPLLGICLGMQLLAAHGTEHGDSIGLGLVPGKIIKLKAGEGLRIPHVGWNEIEMTQEDELLRGINAKTDFYFVHSYYFDADSDDNIVARTPYGINFPSVVRFGHVWGTQFHPEKSGPAGLKILVNFLEV